MVKSVKAVDLKSTFCGFESRLGHQYTLVAQLEEQHPSKVFVISSSLIRGTICGYDGTGIRTCLRSMVLQVQFLLPAPFAELAQR